MKNTLNRIISLVLLVSMTFGICEQTNLIAKRKQFAIEVRSAESRYGDELQNLINASGMSDDKDFTDNVSNLFSELYSLLTGVIFGKGEIDVDGVVNSFQNIFDGLFELDTKLNEVSPESMGKLTNKGFVTLAISFVWDFVTYYDNKRVSQQTMASGVTRLEDIPYIDDGTNEHMLDIYYPENTSEPLPVIIDIHGGGLMMGDKDSNRVYCSILASRGYTVISVNYRLSPDVLYPSQVQDIISAFSWIGSNGGQYYCDFSKVYVTGDSAGGQLAYYAPLVDTSKFLQELYEVSPSGLNIDAVGLVSGMYDMKNGPNSALLSCYFGFDYKNTEYYPYLQPDEVLDLGDMPPAYIVTNARDFLHASGVYMDEVMTDMGVEHQFRDWGLTVNKSSGHITSVAYPELEESQKTIDEMLAFFENHTK